MTHATLCQKATDRPNRQHLPRRGAPDPVAKTPTRKTWLKISIFANAVILLLVFAGVAGAAVIHQSDTNPQLCNLCHPMQANVQSYLTSTNLDNVHMRAGSNARNAMTIPSTPKSRAPSST